jgi:hypothetical protein
MKSCINTRLWKEHVAEKSGNYNIMKPNVIQYICFVSVHFRIRAFDPYNPKTISPSTSGITYWQIEAESSILDGMFHSYPSHI